MICKEIIRLLCCVTNMTERNCVFKKPNCVFFLFNWCYGQKHACRSSFKNVFSLLTLLLQLQCAGCGCISPCFIVVPQAAIREDFLFLTQIFVGLTKRNILKGIICQSGKQSVRSPGVTLPPDTPNQPFNKFFILSIILSFVGCVSS